MAGLREKIHERHNTLSSRSNSCIPKMLSADPFEYAKNFFQSSLYHMPRVNKVTVVDPYIIPIDMDNLASLFGGSGSISLEIVSKFHASKSNEEIIEEADDVEDQKSKEGKKERKQKINERKAYLIRNGLLKDIDFIHSKEPMHDRYYMYWEEGAIVRVFYIGGSVAQRFNDYIGIAEITDIFMLRNITKYYAKLIGNTIKF